jgi:hypothetical protein
MTRSRLGALLLLLGAVAVGAILGGVAVSAAEHRGKMPGRQGPGRVGFMIRLTEELNLSPAQQDSIRAVLKRHDPVMDSLWREVRPRFDSVRAVVRDGIRGNLTEDQKRKYDEMTERRETQYRQRRPSNGRH